MRPILIVAIALCALGATAATLNTPVGEGVTVEGRIAQVCVSISKQNNRLRCTADLEDGTVQVFDSVEALTVGTAVVFSKRTGRYFGNFYARVH